MKNKKLFGKLNIVDLVVILVILAAGIFLAIRYLGIGNGTLGSLNEVKYTVTVEAMSEDLYNQIAPTLPAQMISGEALVTGTILSTSAEPCTVESYESMDPYNTSIIYTIIPDESQKFVTVQFECTATVDAGAVTNSLGTQEIRVGRTHVVKSQDIELVGVITEMTITALP